MINEERILAMEKEVAELKRQLEERPTNIVVHVQCQNPQDVISEINTLFAGVISKSDATYLVGKNV